MNPQILEMAKSMITSPVSKKLYNQLAIKHAHYLSSLAKKMPIEAVQKFVTNEIRARGKLF